MKKFLLLTSSLLLVTSVFGEKLLNTTVRKQGLAKQTVAINVGNAMYAKCLKRNLEISGLFEVASSGSITVSGASGAISVSGAGKSFSASTAFTDDKSARMAARRLADAMCEAYGNQKGFACNQVAFIDKRGADNSELCAVYPDGFDIRRLTADRHAVVGPRWRNATSLFYTNFKNGPEIWELDTTTGKRKVRWSFKGGATGAVISPDGTKVAVILSFQGSPNLYVIDIATGKWQCLTPTKFAVEGEPAWSPDGRSIVYVSDETRRQHLYIVDLATRKSRRITSRGSQNVNPDWGRDGRITYITKQGNGAQIAVLDPAKGDSSATILNVAGNWEHPSWAADSRHVAAESNGRIFLVDTIPEGDGPRQMFEASGKWISPTWSR